MWWYSLQCQTFPLQGELRHFEAKVKKHEHFQDLADRQENKPRRNKKNVALDENDEIKQRADELGRKVSTKEWMKWAVMSAFYLNVSARTENELGADRVDELFHVSLKHNKRGK